MTKPANRNLNGVLLLNKGYGVSSNRALQQVKRLFQAAKAGHTGSLDPLATGVLPICFGEATKFSRFLLDADKTYAVTAKFGITTTTADVEGEVLSQRPVPELTRELLQAATFGFLGATKQIPSMYSALKHNGQPLYKLARQGLEIDRPARDIFVYEYLLVSHTDDTADFIIKCSKGTYIRNLIEDLGEHLGCGAHVASLSRIQSGPFVLENSYTLEQLQESENIDQLLLPCEILLNSVQKLVLDQAQAENIRHGRQIFTPNNIAIGEVSLFGPDNELLGVGEAMNDGFIAPRRIVRIAPRS